MAASSFKRESNMELATEWFWHVNNNAIIEANQ
jgi:hypothetical protein